MSELHTDVVYEDGKHHIISTQDCTPYAEQAAALRAAGATGSRDFKHAAKWPLVLIEQYCNINGITFREWVNDPEHVKRMLNDPGLQAFRIWQGKV